MPNLSFTNPQTSDKYEATVEADRMVHKIQLYSGKLSDITPEMAAAMVADGCNVLKEKSTSTKATNTGRTSANS
jgi:hypothetical protein